MSSMFVICVIDHISDKINSMCMVHI